MEITQNIVAAPVVSQPVKPPQPASEVEKSSPPEMAPVAAKEAPAIALPAEQVQEFLERTRLEAVERAAQILQQAFPEFETFTIYKNTNGQFITRITNHTLNSVKYLPEEDLLGAVKGYDPALANTNLTIKT